MRTRKSPSTNLFAHREDEAFQILTSLEALFARMFPSRGSRWLRTRLHKASARLAEIVLIAAGEDDPNDFAINVKPALRLCRVVDGILKLLHRYDVLNFREYEEAVRLAARLTKVIARRFFGIVSDGNDGSPSSAASGVSSDTLPTPNLDIAAESPPMFS